MKFSLKPFLLTILLAIGFTFQNCNSDDDYGCGCPPILGEYYDVQGLEIDNFKVSPEGSRVKMTENEAVDFEDYNGLHFDYLLEYIGTNCTLKKSWDFSLMNSALACSCIENGWRGAKDETIEELTIITLNDFDQDHLANESINDLFTIEYSNQEDDLTELLLQDTIEIDQYLALGLKKAPVMNDEFKVKVILKLSSDEDYTVESLPIRIMN